ncbi:MAG: hypothetical protein ACYTGV_17955 [Planctomycetota bacterium]|jgi:hypothetical protein
MNTNPPVIFKKLGVPSDVDLEGYGCPECGSPDFNRVENVVEYASQVLHCSWNKNGDFEVDDYGDHEHQDSDHRGYDSNVECADCGHDYDESEAQLSQHYIGVENSDDYGTCLQVCEDEGCEGDCRTDADYPFLGDHGVERYDALGKQLDQLAPNADGFAWDERLGFTLITAMAKDAEKRQSYREGSEQMPCCTSCGGDMSTAYTRTTHLPFKQARYPYSTVEGPMATHVVTMQFQQPICYVCQKG